MPLIADSPGGAASPVLGVVFSSERVLAMVAALAGFAVAPGRGSRTASPYSRGVFSLNGFAAASRSRSTDVPATGLVVFGCFERACFAGALSFPLRLFMARSFEGDA